MQAKMAGSSSRDAMLQQMTLPYHHHAHHAHHTEFITGDSYHLNPASSSSSAVDHTHHALGTGDGYRHPSTAPLRKLTVDLIKTYRKINDVSWERICVCVCVYERERESVCVRVCKRERKKVCVCVCSIG